MNMELQSKHWSLKLGYTPCKEAADWLLTQPSAKKAWQQCKNGFWMQFHCDKLAYDAYYAYDVYYAYDANAAANAAANVADEAYTSVYAYTVDAANAAKAIRKIYPRLPTDYKSMIEMHKSWKEK